MAAENKGARSGKGSTGRQRSTNYPSMNLAWGEDVIQRAHSSGTTNRTALAQLTGYQDDTSGPARSKLAALRHFGLVDYQEGKVIITELGKRVAAPVAGEDVSEALRQSFFNVTAFKQTYDLCAKDALLTKDIISNTAIRQVGITAKAASDFIDIFTRSGVKAGLVEMVDEKSVRILKEPSLVKQPSEQKPIEETPPPPPPATSTLGLQSLTINLQISLPETTDSNVYEEIFKAMKTYLFPGSGK